VEPVELRSLVSDLKGRLDDARSFLDIEGKEVELAELRELASAPDLWDNQDNARAVTSRLARHEQIIQYVVDLESSLDDIDVLLEMAIEDGNGFVTKPCKSQLTRPVTGNVHAATT